MEPKKWFIVQYKEDINEWIIASPLYETYKEAFNAWEIISGKICETIYG